MTSVLTLLAQEEVLIDRARKALLDGEVDGVFGKWSDRLNLITKIYQTEAPDEELARILCAVALWEAWSEEAWSFLNGGTPEGSQNDYSLFLASNLWKCLKKDASVAANRVALKAASELALSYSAGFFQLGVAQGFGRAKTEEVNSFVQEGSFQVTEKVALHGILAFLIRQKRPEGYKIPAASILTTERIIDYATKAGFEFSNHPNLGLIEFWGELDSGIKFWFDGHYLSEKNRMQGLIRWQGVRNILDFPILPVWMKGNLRSSSMTLTENGVEAEEFHRLWRQERKLPTLFGSGS